MPPNISPPDRLTAEEMSVQLAGVTPEIIDWNRCFLSQIAEYQTALESGDEGWTSDVVSEVRKCLSGLSARHLADIRNGATYNCANT